jgi:hypothetical protein
MAKAPLDRSSPTVQMLREEAQFHFQETLEAEGHEGPISHKRLTSPDARVGLALSGGGIRSATFSLGVLQALARCRILTSFDYISTVSGGGYIGSWLTTWAYRHRNGIIGVMDDLVPRTDRGDHEAMPIAHLRRYSNYLTPRVGLLSSDTWTIFGTYLRNLLINWLTLVPYFVLLFLVPVVGVHALDSVVGNQWFHSRLSQVPLSPEDILIFGSLVDLVIAMAVLGISLPSSVDRKAVPSAFSLVAGTQNQFLYKAMLPLVGGGIGLVTAWYGYITPGSGSAASLLAQFGAASALSTWQIFALLGAAAHAAAFGIYAVRRWWVGMSDSRRFLGMTSTIALLQPVAVLVSGAVGGWVVWVGASIVLPALIGLGASSGDPLNATRVYVVMAVPIFLGGFSVGLSLYTALASRRMSEDDREWFARAGAWILAVALGWILMSGIALLGPALLTAAWNNAAAWVVSAGGISGVLSMWLGSSGKTTATEDSPAPKTWITVVADWGLAIAAPVFVVLLAVLLSAGLMGLETYFTSAWPISRLASAGFIAAVCLIVIALVSWTINVNVFSLHGMYRDRLIRAYLGASRPVRKPHPFTGFDPNDNVPMVYLAPPFFNASEWPLVQAIAAALQDPKHSALTRDVLAMDENLLTNAAEIDRIDTATEDRALAIVDRFNAVLIYSKEPLARRQAWEALVPQSPSSFGAHEWYVVCAIARELERAKPIGAAAGGADVFRHFATTMVANNEASWAVDVGRVPIWSKTEVPKLLARLNAVIASYAPAREGGAAGTPMAALGSTSKEIEAALRGQGIPTSPEELRKKLYEAVPRSRPPFHIVNTAINLVSGEELAWQERKAASFTFTPLHAGSPTVGFRAMVSHKNQPLCYGGTAGVSLGTAVAISGAAANPNMGYHSSPIVTLLLTLFNARLGAWLGNPADPRRFTHSCPRNQFLPMALTEALGLTHGRGGYVHLSDGGHFENLGLYELVRRGCKFILVCDGGCDRDYAFEDLGNAVRKIRIDLGVEIRFQGFRVGPQRRHVDGGAAVTTPGNYIAVGTIDYGARAKAATSGHLLYIKPAVFEEKDEPVDVWQYGRLNPAYPHETTRDQWFNESQFESYRALGEHIMRTVAGTVCVPSGLVPPPIEDLFKGAEQYLARVPAVPMSPPVTPKSETASA